MLNRNAFEMVELLHAEADTRRLIPHDVSGASSLDCGIACDGGIETGLDLAWIGMGGLGQVDLVPTADGLAVQVRSDAPVRACLSSQYAGWPISIDGYFAMGSGPMRAIHASESIFREVPHAEESPVAVGVLETRQMPTPEVVAWLAAELKMPAESIHLLVAPTASLAGTIQVVARCLETCLHKLHALKFPLDAIVSGTGIAPMPPIGRKDIQSIGWTNDAILYGGTATLWVRCDDDVIAEVGPKVPSSASADYGSPFGEIFRRYGHDFYKIDPLLFSPARVTFYNLTSGRTFHFGALDPAVMAKSFGT